MRIGFIGTGPMGAAMARRLLSAGHELVVYNRTQEKARPFVEAGGRLASTPAEAAAGAELVFTMVADDAALQAVTFDEAGLLAALGKDAIHVSCSTISVALSDRLAAAHDERGQGYVAATVLGRPPAAEAGELFVMAAGPERHRERALPALQAIGQRIFTVSDEASRSNLLKLSLNFLILSTIEQMGELFALNEKGGNAPDLVFDIMTNTMFGAPVHRNYGRLIVEQQFEGGVPATLGAKDTRLLLAASEALQVPMPMANLVRDRLLATMARGEGEEDFVALSKRAREEAGLPPLS